jgi:hypothetical protein
MRKTKTNLEEEISWEKDHLEDGEDGGRDKI